MNDWESVWMDASGEVWGYPYPGVDGSYMGLGKVDVPFSAAEIVQRYGGPLRRLIPEPTAVRVTVDVTEASRALARAQDALDDARKAGLAELRSDDPEDNR